MEYIFLAAGVGSRLYPYTKNTPKCLVRVGDNETVIMRAMRLIRQYDKDANFTIVTGFCADMIEQNVTYPHTNVYNPFYKVTNSVASLWFAKNILIKGNAVVILNGDIVFSSEFAQEITSYPNESVIYYDSSIKTNGDYNVQVLDGNMVVMGKELTDYDGEFVGITKFTCEDLPCLLQEVDKLVNEGLYDQWYENGLVQLSLNGIKNFRAKDVSEYQWSEIDSIDNLLKIKKIIRNELT